MKTNLILVFLLITIGVKSQSIEQYISKDSKAVVEVDGGQIFNLIDYADLEMLMPPDPSGAPLDLDQYGIDVKSKAYYFYQVKDSIAYQNVVVRLSDAQKAEELIRSMVTSPSEDVGGFNLIVESGMSAAWNGTTAIFSYVDFPTKVFTMEDLLEEKEQEREVVGDGDEAENNDEALEMQLMLKNLSAPPMYSEEQILKYMMDNFSSILNNGPAQSILQDASYTSGKESNSSAYFWVNNLEALLNENVPSDLSSMIPMGADALGGADMPLGLESMSSNLIFNEDEIRFDTKFGVNPSIAGAFTEMYDSKMDKSFFKHFDQDDVMSYMSFTMDMTKMMTEYPAMLKSLYSAQFPKYKDEIDITMDLIEVVFDEKAIGELFTGDGLIMLHDFESQEVTFKTTEYDDDFNATEVEKTKMESLPIFSMMIGSENKKIINKLMKLARKYEVASNEGSHHRIASKEMGAPFDMYFTHEDGIVYFTNSKSKIGNYATGKKNCNLGKHKKMLKNNVFNLYLDTSSTIENLSSMIPADPKTLEYMKTNYKEMFMTMGPMENNKFNLDMVIKTTDSKGNSLKLILDSVGTMMGM